MIYERLILMRDLMAKDGSIYLHCDWRLNSLLRLALDEVFGSENYRLMKSDGNGSLHAGQKRFQGNMLRVRMRLFITHATVIINGILSSSRIARST
jgi:hypothetical protein